MFTYELQKLQKSNPISSLEYSSLNDKTLSDNIL